MAAHLIGHKETLLLLIGIVLQSDVQISVNCHVIE